MQFEPPTGEGYYWWTNFGEHTPTIMRVTRSHSRDKSLYADNGEYNFPIDSEPNIQTTPEGEDEEPVITIDGVDYYYGTDMWSKAIELPEINGEFILPDSF